jgi:NAD(P)-dependent dehydrogenase (short-subunit alcohol dehydrogenase family)
MQAVMPHMISRKYGKILNVASTAGKWASSKQAAYNAAKHGVVGLTRCVALEMAANGITVNAICPGMVQTDLLSQYLDDYAARGFGSAEAMHDDLVKRIPIGRFVEIAECGHLAVYLASPESDGMTGQSILLDGGVHYV